MSNLWNLQFGGTAALPILTRGVHKKNSMMITSQFKGSFSTDERLRDRFLDFIKD